MIGRHRGGAAATRSRAAARRARCPSASRPIAGAPLVRLAVLDRRVGHREARTGTETRLRRAPRAPRRRSRRAAVLLDGDHARGSAARARRCASRRAASRSARSAPRPRCRAPRARAPLRARACAERAERDDRDVVAVAQQLRLADRERLHVGVERHAEAVAARDSAAPRGPGARSRSSACGAARSRPSAPSRPCSAARADRRCRTGPGASRRRRRPGRRGRARRSRRGPARRRRARPGRRRAAGRSSRSRRPASCPRSRGPRRRSPRAARRCRRRRSGRGSAAWNLSSPVPSGIAAVIATMRGSSSRELDQRVGEHARCRTAGPASTCVIAPD